MTIIATGALVAVGAAAGSGFYRAAVSMADPLSSTDAGSPLAVLLNGGILGVVLVLFLIGKITTGRELDRVVAERDAAQGELRALRSSYEEVVIPAMIRDADVMGRAIDLIARAEAEQRVRDQQRRASDP